MRNCTIASLKHIRACLKMKPFIFWEELYYYTNTIIWFSGALPMLLNFDSQKGKVCIY